MLIFYNIDFIWKLFRKGKSVMLPSYENELRPENEESMWNLELNSKIINLVLYWNIFWGIIMIIIIILKQKGRNSEVALEGPS